MNKISTYARLAICIVFLASCATRPEPAAFDKADMLGVVYDGDAEPVAGMHVSIDGAAPVFSDVNGRFTLSQITKGSHTLVAQGKDFETITLDFDFLQRTQFLFLTTHSLKEHLNAAEQYFQRNEFSLALEQLDKANSINPANSTVWYFMAIVHERTADFEKAEDCVRTLVERGVRTFALANLDLDLADLDPSYRSEVLDRYRGDALVAFSEELMRKYVKLVQKTSDESRKDDK